MNSEIDLSDIPVGPDTTAPASKTKKAATKKGPVTPAAETPVSAKAEKPAKAAKEKTGKAKGKAEKKKAAPKAKAEKKAAAPKAKAEKKERVRRAKPATIKDVPEGITLWPLGTRIEYKGGSKCKWLKAGMKGEIVYHYPGAKTMRYEIKVDGKRTTVSSETLKKL